MITIGSSVITIPVGSGISRVKIKASVNWQGTASGHRKMVIEQNSGGGFTGNWVGASGSGQNATTDGQGLRMYAETPTINVVGGYQFRIVTSQTSGGTLNLLANRTWVEVEVVE